MSDRFAAGRSERTTARQPTEDPGLAAAYVGDKGNEYFAYQRQIGALGGKLNARKFQSFIPPDAVVLDFGCGGGYLLRALECGRRLGVEPNRAAREACVDGGVECHPSMTYIDDRAVDVIVSNHVLEHVPYPIAALRECRRVLKPSGILILCVPIDDWRTQKRYIEDDPNHHLNTWTPLLLGNTLGEAGFAFNTEDIRILAEAWPPHVGTLARILPARILALTMRAWAVLRNRRQILAVAHPSGT
jgi:SAM-dependent methyltransferase